MAASGISGAITAELLASGKYSDLTITCHGRSFKVHQAIVCMQSKPIAAMVDGNFREAIERVIDFPENNPDVIEKMIEYMYRGNYSDPSEVSSTSALPISTSSTLSIEKPFITPRKKPKRRSEQMMSARAKVFSDTHLIDHGTAVLLNAQVFVTAEQYDLPNLKRLAQTKYERSLYQGWNGSQFVDSLKIMYTSLPESDRALKDVAMKVMSERASQLLDRGEFVQLCKDNGEIAVDSLKSALMSKTSVDSGSDEYIARSDWSDEFSFP